MRSASTLIVEETRERDLRCRVDCYVWIIEPQLVTHEFLRRGRKWGTVRKSTCSVDQLESVLSD